MGGRETGSPTAAIAALVNAGIPHRVRRYGHDPASTSYGAKAAALLGVDAGRGFKTLIAQATSTLVVAVVPVTGEVDMRALAGACGTKRG